MMHKIDEIDASGYRKFGLAMGGILIVLFGVLIPWVFDLNGVLWPWVLGGGLAVVGLLVPMTLRPIYIAWMKFGLIMNWINIRIILGVLFYFVFLPVGLIFRLLGNDPMNRKLDDSVTSYRVNSAPEQKNNMERPY